jgi:formate dehydrogenase iron-sulfur subunit
MSKAILYDATQCIGCLECEGACAKANGLPYDETVAKMKKTYDAKFTYVAARPGDKYMRRLCMHCNDPSCVSVCPVGALEKTANGPVTYDADKCMGCRYCMVACPFGIPKYEWTKAIPTVKKCTMCADRGTMTTACADACPTGATFVGDRDQLLAEAHRRINSNPGTYLNHVYGEHEVGGTGVMMLSSIPFGEFGLPTQYGSEPLPQLTGKVLAHIPDVVTLGGAVLGGIYWITHRREVVAAMEKEDEEVKR